MAEERVAERARTRLAGGLLALACLAPVRAQDGVQDPGPDLEARLGSAAALLAAGDPAAARARFEELLGPGGGPEPTERQRGRALFGLGRSLAALGEADAAEQALAASIEAFRAEGREPDDELVEARRALARLHLDRGRVPEALALFEAIQGHYDAHLPAAHLDRGRNLVARGKCLNLLGVQHEARGLFEEGLAILERELPAGDVELARARSDTASCLGPLGELEAAADLYRTAMSGLQGAEGDPDPVVLALARSGLGITERLRGRTAEAQRLFEEALVALEEHLSAEHPQVAMVRANLATVLEQLGDYARSRAIYERTAAELARAYPPGHLELLRARMNLAEAYALEGDFAGSQALIEALLPEVEAVVPADHPVVLQLRSALASNLNNQDRPAEARVLLEAVLEASLRTGAAPEEIASHRLNLATTHLTSNRIAEGAELCALALGELEEESALRPHALQTLATFRLAEGRHAEARELFGEVVALLEGSVAEGHQNLALARRALLWIAHREGDEERTLAAAHGEIERMRERIRSCLTRAPREARSILDQERGLLAILHAVAGGEAGSALRPELLGLQETMRLVATTVPSFAAREDPEVERLRSEAGAWRSRLHDLRAAPATPERERALVEAAFERDRLEAGLRERLARTAETLTEVSAAALASALPEGTCAVGYRRVASSRLHVGRGLPPADTLGAYVLAPGGEPDFVELGTVPELAGLVAAWRDAIGRPLDTGDAAVAGDALASGRATRGRPVAGAEPLAEPTREGAALRAALLDPVLARLPADCRELVVCLDDALFLVPLDALPMGDPPSSEGAELVGDRYRIRPAPSFGPLLRPRAPAGGEPSMLVVGGVSFGAPVGPEADPGLPVPGAALASEAGAARPRYAALPETRAEAEWLAGEFERRFERAPALLSGAAATKRRVVEGLEAARYVHLATHGYFAEEHRWARSDASGLAARPEPDVVDLTPLTLAGLALAGADRGRDGLGRVVGILTGEELAGLDLSRCELAVLSACETNVGVRYAGQGIQSLQTALHAAGVRTTVTSLWRVEDAATRELMQAFYRALWEEGLDPAEALWRAKCERRERGAPVRDWAGWVVTGG